MSSLTKIARPAYQSRFEGQWKLFVASGFGQAAWFLWPQGYAPWWVWTLVGLIAFAAIRPAFEGLTHVFEDYRLRLSWNEAQNPTSAKNTEHNFATFAERQAAGMYDGKGRTYGLDENGYVLSEPHKLRPNFSLIIGGQGSGKTSTGSAPSIFLSALSHRPGTEARK